MAADITEGISGKPRDNIGQHVRWWPQHTVSLTTRQVFLDFTEKECFKEKSEER